MSCFTKTLLLLLAVWLPLSGLLQAQASGIDYSLQIRRSAGPIKLDGVLDEPAWQAADVTRDFFQSRPFDTSFAQLQTKVRVSFDDHFLYVGVVCYQPRSSYTVSSLKRDFAGGASDVFVMNFDPFRDGVNGFHFGLSPYNVQREGLIDNGQNISNFWDNRWFSQVSNHDDRWEAEIAIPFKTLRYKLSEGENVWRVNFGRNTLAINEISSWVPVPRNFPPNSLAFAGRLVWLDPPPAPGLNVSLIPYATGRVAQDYPRNSSDLSTLDRRDDLGGDVGLDAKVAVTPSLNLDITVNPDFSQVEVDRQVTNLSRFELFFPERRQFFLENNDLFGLYGFPDSRPFFSRRIGLAFDPTLGQNVPAPILGGLRLSGKLNQNWRLGLLNLQTRHIDFGGGRELPAANFSVATLQRRVFERSVLGGFVVNKQNFLGKLPEDQRGNFSNYSRAAGLEFNYFSPDSRWETESYFHRSFNPEQGKNPNSFAQFIGYTTANVRLLGAYKYVGPDFQSEAGFVPRPAVQDGFANLAYIYYPKGKLASHINNISLGVEGTYVFDLAGRPLDRSQQINLTFLTPDASQASLSLEQIYTFLVDADFDPTNPFLSPDPEVRNDFQPLPAGGYTYNRWGLRFTSSQRYNLSASAQLSGGQYFTGEGLFVNAELGYRFQPIGVISLAFSYNDIRFDAPLNSARYFLIGPQAELSFSRNMFFSTFFQYNRQTNNININSRFQWRFAPVSDLFLVYTDNYFAEPIPNFRVQRFAPRNRTLVLKLTYWLAV